LSRPARYILITITAAFVLLTLLKSFISTTRYGGADLRTRIVGTRLISTTNSPYFYKWNPEDGDRYVDPLDVDNRLVNGNVVTPAVSMAIYPLSLLPYPGIRMIWTLLQIIAALVILYCLCKTDDSNTTIIASSFMLLGLICSDVWFYNIERGQMYIFYALLLALMYRSYTSTWKYNEFLSGFIGGFFILFRPFAGIIGLAFLLNGRTRWIKGCITGFVLACALFILPKPALWSDYFKAMKEYVSEYTGHPHTISNPIVNEKPVIIEGATNLDNYQHFDLNRLETVYHYLNRMGIPITSTGSLILYANIILILSVFFYRMRKRVSSPESLFLFGFLLFILTELLFATPRAGYNIIEWIFPLSIICVSRVKSRSTLILLGFGLLLLHYFPFPLPHQGEAAEVIFLGLTAYSIFFAGSSKKLQHGVSRARQHS
jgi:hypothetical protein